MRDLIDDGDEHPFYRGWFVEPEDATRLRIRLWRNEGPRRRQWSWRVDGRDERGNAGPHWRQIKPCHRLTDDREERYEGRARTLYAAHLAARYALARLQVDLSDLSVERLTAITVDV